MSNHPSELELEELRTGDAEAATEQHVALCDQCQGRLGALRQLAEELSAPGEHIAIPRSIDDKMAEMARYRAAAVTRKNARAALAPLKQRWLRWAAPVAVAASLVLLVMVPMVTKNAPESTAVSTAGRRDIKTNGDFNGDGEVNIVDAMLLARAIKRGQSVDPRLDLTGDLKVDNDDAQFIARRAVRLKGEQP